MMMDQSPESPFLGDEDDEAAFGINHDEEEDDVSLLRLHHQQYHTSLTPGFQRMSTSSTTTPMLSQQQKGGGGEQQQQAPFVLQKGAGGLIGRMNGGGTEVKENMIKKMRDLASSALYKRQDVAAAYFADKLVGLTNGKVIEDVLLLAQAYHQGRDYRRAVHILETHGLLAAAKDMPEPLNLQQLLRSPSSSSLLEAYYLAAQCLVASDRYEDCLQLLEQVLSWGEEEEEDNDEAFANLRSSLMSMISGGEHAPNSRQSMENGGGGAASSSEPIGKGGRTRQEDLLSTLASMCCIRGKVYESQDNRSRAVTWLKHALRLDAYCVEALEFLVQRKLLSNAEERALLSSNHHQIPFDTSTTIISPSSGSSLPRNEGGGGGKIGGQQQQQQREMNWLRLFYSIRLCLQDTTVHEEEFHALEALGLGDNLSVLAAKAEAAYYQQNIQLAYELSKQVYQADPYNESCLPIYLCAMADLSSKTELYYCAHQLVEAQPKSAISWFAVGCYYATVKKNESAQRYFHKATKLDHRFAPAWMGFGNAFAAQDESDQAMSAYRTASRLLPSSHIPLLYIGMEYLRTNNLSLAHHFLQAAKDLCAEDPLLHNEMGVVLFRSGKFEEAAHSFQKVLNLCRSFSNNLLEQWEGTIVNLGHCYRKCQNYAQAIKHYEMAIGLCPRRACSYACLAYTHHLESNLDIAIEYYHRALGLKADDSFASEMLSRALETVLNGS